MIEHVHLLNFVYKKNMKKKQILINGQIIYVRLHMSIKKAKIFLCFFQMLPVPCSNLLKALFL